MIRIIDLGDNSERETTARALQTLKPDNLWFELVDPTAEELEAVAEKTEIPADLLRLPDVSNIFPSNHLFSSQKVNQQNAPNTTT